MKNCAASTEKDDSLSWWISAVELPLPLVQAQGHLDILCWFFALLMATCYPIKYVT